jgi:hypothetical protein
MKLISKLELNLEMKREQRDRYWLCRFAGVGKNL